MLYIRKQLILLCENNIKMKNIQAISLFTFPVLFNRKIIIIQKENCMIFTQLFPVKKEKLFLYNCVLYIKIAFLNNIPVTLFFVPIFKYKI